MRIPAFFSVLLFLLPGTAQAADLERAKVTFSSINDRNFSGGGLRIEYGTTSSKCMTPESVFTFPSDCASRIPQTRFVRSGSTARFVDENPSAERCFKVTLESAAAGSPESFAVRASATLTDPGARRRNFGPYSLKDEQSRTISLGATPKACRANRRPVAREDAWKVRAGRTVEDSFLDNDFDPDGDPIQARVTSISFSAREWSGTDKDGTFLYTAGPGTIKELVKKITYHVVDSKGARSKSVISKITVKPLPKAPTSPFEVPFARSSASATTAAAPKAYSAGAYPGYAWTCFGGGLDTECYYMLSVSRAAELNNYTGWGTSTSAAAQACLRFGFVPLKNAACAKKLVGTGISAVWDKSVLSNAAKFGYCVMYRVERHRTLAHPRAGEWSNPEYRSDDSLVRPYTGNQRISGHGEWSGVFSSYRIPLFCDGRGKTWVKANEPKRKL